MTITTTIELSLEDVEEMVIAALTAKDPGLGIKKEDLTPKYATADSFGQPTERFAGYSIKVEKGPKPKAARAPKKDKAADPAPTAGGDGG